MLSKLKFFYSRKKLLQSAQWPPYLIQTRNDVFTVLPLATLSAPSSTTRVKMVDIFEMTFWNAFSWTKSFVFWFKFHFRWCRSAIWPRKWLGAKKAISNYLNQWRPSSIMHICATWPQWLNGTIWWASQLYFLQLYLTWIRKLVCGRSLN